MPLDTDDAFAELGLRPDATEAEVKAAWRRLVSQWHPDRNASIAAVEKMQRINRAFKAIRQAGFAAAGAAPEAPAPRPQPDPAQRKNESARPNSDSAKRTAGASTNGRPRRTISRKVKLTLEEAAVGVTRMLRGKITDACRECDGIGYRVLGGHCAECQGSGAVRQRSWFGWIGGQSECEACHGGGIARQRCTVCDGTASETLDYALRFRLPPGVRHGDQLHVDSANQKSGPAPVDLNIRVELLEHKLLHLDGDGTIRCEVPVDGFTWIANRTIDVPTLSGLHQLQLDREQLSYRLRGKGFPVERRGAPADQWIIVTPIFPTTLNTDQQILLDQLIATTAGPDNKPTDDRLRRWSESLRSGGEV